MRHSQLLLKESIESVWIRMIKKIETRWIIPFLLFLAIFSFVAFFRLGVPKIENWDEARHGVNAYEMLVNQEYVLSTYGFSPDYYNLKPPLSYWLIALSYKIFGFNAFALRFYSALGYFLTGVFVSLSLKKHHGKISSLVSLLLFTMSFDLFSHQMARTGDADALYILFYTISMLSTIEYVDNEKPKYLYFASFSFSLAFLTKSFHAGCIVVTMAVILLLTKKMRTLSTKTCIISIICALLPILLWAAARYGKDGFTFMEAMFSYDFIARSSKPLEGHTGSYLYYVKGMLDYWSTRVLVILFLIGFHIQLKSRTQISMRHVSYIIWGIIPLVLFSIARTKLLRYVYPANIALIVIGSVSFASFLQMSKQSILKILLSFSLIFLILSNIANNAKTVVNAINDSPVQTFMLQKMNRESCYFGRTCYIVTNDWQQCELLQAELSAGLKCIGGGSESFIRSDTGSLLLITDLQATDMSAFSDYSILASDENCCLIGK